MWLTLERIQQRAELVLQQITCLTTGKANDGQTALDVHSQQRQPRFMFLQPHKIYL
jgi:hypothetical protein